MRPSSMAAAMAVVTSAALMTAPARAVDPFEIQVYDGTASAPGAFGLELHTNYVGKGLTTSIGPELPQNHQGHFTLEPSLGLLPWWELGGYLQSAVRADGTFDYAGFKLRSKFVTPPGWHDRLRLGANLEVSYLPEKYDRNGWGGELRTIVSWENDEWLLAVNPIIDVSFKGESPTFDPALKVSYKWDAQLGVGLEYYGGMGAIGDGFAPLRDQEHYLYEVIDLLSLDRIELNAGIGEGLTPGSNAIVAKLIVGYELEGAAKSTGPQRAALAMHPRRVTP